jgi:hypothetical protein
MHSDVSTQAETKFLFDRAIFIKLLLWGPGGLGYSGREFDHPPPLLFLTFLAMSQLPSPIADEVELLIRNAQLRDELEPYLDESVDFVTVRKMSLAEENEFLESILEWERAPSLPICKWFQPELILPRPEALSDEEVHALLWRTIHQLYGQKIALDFTDHLSDRQLYCVLMRDILPVYQKKISDPRHFLHWHCLDENDIEDWLRYYATDEERERWSDETEQPLPARKPLPFPRQMPRRPSHLN